MKNRTGASLWLAPLIICAFASAVPSAHARMRCDTDPVLCSQAGDIAETEAALEAWLDRNSIYPRREGPLVIRLVDARQAAQIEPALGFADARRRGLYLPELATILLVAPWKSHDPVDVSVLLHELVHHRQVGARHWYCEGQQELPAYRLQQRWLAERGLDIRVNWTAVVIESGCVRRDIHPD